MLIYEPQFEFMLPVTSYFHNILMDSIPNINDNNDNEQTIILPLKKVFPCLFIHCFCQHLSPVIVSWQEFMERNKECTNLFPEFGSGVCVRTPNRLNEWQKVKRSSLELKFKGHGPKENYDRRWHIVHSQLKQKGSFFIPYEGVTKCDQETWLSGIVGNHLTIDTEE